MSQWEEDHERHFVVLDTRFLDLMEQQIKERSQKKENEKMKKVKDHYTVGVCLSMELLGGVQHALHYTPRIML